MKFRFFNTAVLTTLVASMLLVLGGCTATNEVKKDVEMRGSNLSAIEGHWTGEYSSAITKRSGPISFDLSSNQDKAVGHIILEAYVLSKRPGSNRKSRVRLLTKKAQPLEISFVAIENGQISGAVTPYMDPASKKMINTTFIGTLSGNQISGTFKSSITGSSDYFTGVWSVSRGN